MSDTPVTPRPRPDLARLMDTERHLIDTLSTRVPGDGFTTHRCERHPAFYGINVLEITSPGTRTLGEWEALFRVHFPAETYSHVGLILAAGVRAPWLEIEAAGRGWTVEHLQWMYVADAAGCRPLPPGIHLETLEGEAGWMQLLDFDLDRSRAEPWFRGDDSIRRLHAAVRELSERAGITWFAAKDEPGGALLARLGVVRHGEVCRLQDVYTHASARGRGLASGLLSHAIRYSLDVVEARGLVLCAEQGSEAVRLYERLGFQTVGTSTCLMSYPPRSTNPVPD